jgi:hypothetical protein
MPAKPASKRLLLTLDVARCPLETLQILVSDPTTSGAVLHEVARLHRQRAGMLLTLIRHPNARRDTLVYLYNNGPKEVRAAIASRKTGTAPADAKAVVPSAAPDDGEQAGHRGGKSGGETLFQQLQNMTVAEKVQFAMHAPKEARAVMIRDANRIVAMAVLHSPKMTEDEAVFFAASRNVSEDVLREIARKREWMAEYAVLKALVNNPKTPIGVSMPLINQIQQKDLVLLAKNKNLPEGLRTAVNRILAQRQKH